MLLVAALLLSGYLLAAEGCRAPIVEIVVSPVVDKKTLRVMDIAWEVGSHWRAGDWVGLYNSPPNAATNPVFKANADKNLGDVRTGVKEGRILLEPNYGKRCLGWWAAYWHANDRNPVAVSCLSTNPRWMEEMRGEIGNLPLNNMFLPGTHDSGAFHIAYSPFEDNRVNKYIYTQDETIMEQLIHGARMLDLRVALHQKQFWINHGIVSIHPLEHVLNDVKTFVEKTNEIVILDIHEFPQGIKDQATHNKLIDFVKSKIGHLMAPPHVGWGVTLNQLWNMNKRIVVGYNDKQIARERAGDVFWPVSQKWGDKRKIGDLFNYFNDMFKAGPPNTGGVCWSAMAELTPIAWDVISDRLKGLRRMADTTNKQITSWFRGDWGRIVNGVSVDFIRSTGIVDAAIRWNRRRARGKTCD